MCPYSGIRCGIRECFHDLDNYFYKLYRHPYVDELPICACCNDDIEQGLFFGPGDRISDICSLCGDGGDLQQCSNKVGSGIDDFCPHAFCVECIETYMGCEALAEAQTAESWFCLKCDGSKLSEHLERFTSASKNSIFSKATSSVILTDIIKHEAGCSETFQVEDFVDEAELQTRLTLHILNSFEDEILVCEEKLEENSIEKLKNEILLEVETIEDLESEICAFKITWQKHHEILHLQKVQLQETLSDKDLMAFYALRDDALRVNEKSFGRSILPRSSWKDCLENGQVPLIVTQCCQVAEAQSPPVQEISSRNSILVPLERQNVPSSFSRPLTLEFQEFQDQMTELYSAKEDLVYSDYPPDFLEILPESIIKVLWYSQDFKEREEIQKKYDVPAHVMIITRYSLKPPVPARVKDWSIAPRVHGSVLKSLYYADTPKEHAVLAEKYGLEDDIVEVDDMGDIYELDSDYRGEKKQSVNYVGDMQDALREEDAKSSRIFGTKQRKSLAIPCSVINDQKEEEREVKKLKKKLSLCQKGVSNALKNVFRD